MGDCDHPRERLYTRRQSCARSNKPRSFYYCPDCGMQSSAQDIEGAHLSVKQIDSIYDVMVDGKLPWGRIREVQRRAGVSYKTAWKWAHLIADAMDETWRPIP
jgi:transposase-like protein